MSIKGTSFLPLSYNSPVSSFAGLLLEYYDKNKRALPWRADTIPYHVWISEIMLQQTRIETVKERYASFLKSFPNVETLADAPEEMVLKEWEGLGYYSRARNLRKGAATIVRNFNGELPKTKAELMTIPGIGDYSSSAISSIAFNEPEIALDGNLFRVYARVNLVRKRYEDVKAKKGAIQFYKEKMPLERCGDFNEALMELGETVCLPNGKPLCERCPLRCLCKAHKTNQEMSVPLPKFKKERGRVAINVYLITWKDMVLIRKRENKGLLAATYEFPNYPRNQSDEMGLQELSLLGPISFLGNSKHAFSHLEWDMDWYEIKCNKEPELSGCILVPAADLKTVYMLPNAFTKFCKNNAILGF